MSESLSRDEIDALLSAIDSGNDAEPAEAEAEAAPPPPRIAIYDFKRPERFSRERMRDLAGIHERFARSASMTLSRLTRVPALVRVASTDQLAYEEFIRSLPSPTLLCELAMDPLPGPAILEIDPSLCFALVELLFGGPGRGPKPERELSDIELALMEGIVVRLLGELRAAWEPFLELSPRLAACESNPQLAQITPSREMVALVTLEAKVGEVEGLLNLCLPYPTLAPFLASREGPPSEPLQPLLGPAELDGIRMTRYAIFNAEDGGPTARELSASLAAGESPAFESVGRAAFGAASRRREEGR